MANEINNALGRNQSPSVLRKRAEFAQKDIAARAKSPGEIQTLMAKLPPELRPFMEVPRGTGTPTTAKPISERSAHQVSRADGNPVSTDTPFDHALAAGDRSSALTSARDAHAVTAGYRSSTQTLGPKAHAVAVGNESSAESDGGASHAINAGIHGRAGALGANSIAAVLGPHGHARAGENGALILHHYDAESDRPRIKVGYVGENGIKPHTWYRLHPETSEFEQHDPD